MIKRINIVMLAALLGVLYSSCEKEYDAPPERTIPEGNKLTITEIRQMYEDSVLNTGASSYKFDGDYSTYAYVTADESSGNLYKEVYVRGNYADGDSAAINLQLLYSGGVYQGDYVRIYLKGVVLTSYRGMVQLDSVNVDEHIIKQSTDNVIEPEIVTIDQIDSAYQAKLIKLENVQFPCGELNNTYADKVNQQSENRMLEDCDGNQVIVRTSGYANFANNTIPEGNGEFIAVVGQFDEDMQLFIRDIDEVQLNSKEDRCGADCFFDCSVAQSTINEGFSSVVDGAAISDLNCWNSITTAGSVSWEGTEEDNGEKAAYATSYLSGDASNVMWLVSPKLQFDGGDTLSFRSATRYHDHNAVSVWVSTDYNGDPSTASWTQVSATFAGSAESGTFSNPLTWKESGDIELFGYFTENYSGTYYVAFKYEGSQSSSNDSNYYIDDVQIRN